MLSTSNPQPPPIWKNKTNRQTCTMEFVLIRHSIYKCFQYVRVFWLIRPAQLPAPLPSFNKVPRIPPPTLLNGSASRTNSIRTCMAKLPAFFTRRAVARPVRVPSPSHHYNKTQSFLQLDNQSTEFSSKSSSEISFNEDAVSKLEQGGQQLSDSNLLQSAAESNRVMVVVDSSPEAQGALKWALSHTLQTQDTVILLHISKPSKHYRGMNSSLSNQKAYELLYSMKNACQMKRPGVQVEIAVRGGKEKAPIIVEEAKQRKVSLLVLGQKRRSIMWCLQKMWAGKRRRKNRVVDYCIQNANCLTIAVRRKGRRHGGYLITTKRHKNFWLLA